MGKIIAISNQKGGTGKTTTTVNLGIGLANKGNVIDTDVSDAEVPQQKREYAMAR